MVVSMIDAITLFAMDEKVFDEKYNGIPQKQNDRRKRGAEQKEHRSAPRKRTNYQERTSARKAPKKHNPYKKSGLEKFNDFDYAGAIADFKKSLEITPNDINSHFSIACAYSLTENADLSFSHIDQAVALGFKDFDKIKSHKALAYLRIQPAFEPFEANGFRLPEKKEKTTEKTGSGLLEQQPDLLDQ